MRFGSEDTHSIKKGHVTRLITKMNRAKIIALNITLNRGVRLVYVLINIKQQPEEQNNATYRENTHKGISCCLTYNRTNLVNDMKGILSRK